MKRREKKSLFVGRVSRKSSFPNKRTMERNGRKTGGKEKKKETTILSYKEIKRHWRKS